MKTIISIAAVLILAIMAISVIGAHPVFALKNLFNCITNASSGGHLSFRDYVKCFNQQFHGQLNDQPATMSDSVKP